MNHNDGRLYAKTKGKELKFISFKSTRWAELQDTVKYQLKMGALLDSTTIFKFVNSPGFGISQHFIVGEDDHNVEAELHDAQEIIRRASPNGTTPLTRHVLDVVSAVNQMNPELRRTGQKICIVIATDGVPTNEDGKEYHGAHDEFFSAVQLLQRLPVSIVFRLYSSEDRVLDYYEKFDAELEIPVEAIDDFVEEAKQVYRHNNWINYCLPLHRCREFGHHDRLFDLIDERSLTGQEACSFCELILGPINNLPNPIVDFRVFAALLHIKMDEEKLQWNPVSQKMKPWFSVRKMKHAYAPHVVIKDDCSVM